MLGITGSEREYRLWVYSGREEAPYQLIGHEFPYGITMSHLRDMAFLMQESEDSPTTSNLQEPFFMEQLPQEMQCHFILKPSQVAVAQQLGGQRRLKEEDLSLTGPSGGARAPTWTTSRVTNVSDAGRALRVSCQNL
nr:rho GTPase-activating protein 20 [Camelus dromedarius]